MTGFFQSVSGLSFTNDSRAARETISGSNSGRARASFVGSSEVGSSDGPDAGATGDGVLTAMGAP